MDSVSDSETDSNSDSDSIRSAIKIWPQRKRVSESESTATTNKQ